MAIIFSYPKIITSDITGDDLMIISDMTKDGKPTKTISLSNLATYITGTGSGTGTTDTLTMWANGPGGLLGDSLIAQDAGATTVTITGNTVGTGNLTISGVAQSVFGGQVTIPLTPVAPTDAASKGYVDTEIAGIPAGLIFQGNWDASAPLPGGTPDLTNVALQVTGHYYVVTTGGAAEPNGLGTLPDSWSVGDWVVFIEQGATDRWEKIDQTFIAGSGLTGQVTFWNSVNTVTGDNDFFWDDTNKRLGIATAAPSYKLDVIGNARISTTLSVGSTPLGGAEVVTIRKQATGINAQLIIAGVADWTRQLQLGYDTTNNYGFIQANESGVSTQSLSLNPSGGNVGIGTVSPGATLHIDSVSTYPTLTLARSTVHPGLSFTAGLTNFTGPGTDLVIEGVGNDTGFGFRTVNSAGTLLNTLILIPSGNVGIGTTTPDEKLHILDTTGANIILNSNAVAANSGVYMSEGADATPTQNGAYVYYDGTNNEFRIATGAAALADRLTIARDTGAVQFNEYGGGTFSGTATYDLSVDVNGNIIETTGGGAGGPFVPYMSGADQIARTECATYNTSLGCQALQNLAAGTEYNTALGYQAGTVINTGVQNTLIGAQSGASLTSGANNVAIGYNALSTETTGHGGVAIGAFALELINSGNTYNTAVGFSAGATVSTGVRNTVVGAYAGDALTTGAQNTAIGYEALSTEDTHGNNTAVGFRSLKNQDAGADAANTAVGYNSGTAMTTGLYNTLVGGNAGSAIQSGSGNTIMGLNAGDAITTGWNNTAIGQEALSSEDTTSGNTAIGFQTLKLLNAGSNAYNVAVGYVTGEAMTTGVRNTIIGSFAGDAITGGSNNTAIGYNALSAEDAHGNNVAIGGWALENLNAGAEGYNVAVGINAGQAMTTGFNNTLIGGNAGANILAATDNVLVGTYAGDALTGGIRNVAVGTSALGAEDAHGYNTAIGHGTLQVQNAGANAYNTAVGYEAGNQVSTGIRNTLIGGLAGDALAGGSHNVALGTYALSTEDTHGKNIAIGYSALLLQNAGADAYNVAIGYNTGAAISTGVRNTIVGGLAGNDLSTGSYNTALGYDALSTEDTGQSNTAIGYEALKTLNYNGHAYNTAVGLQAGTLIDTGFHNTIIGALAGAAMVDGVTNTLVGYKSGGAVADGMENTFIGNVAGSLTTDSEKCTFIGSEAGNALNYSGENNTVIGYNAEPSAIAIDDEITLGDGNVGTLRCQVNTITLLSDERDKTDIQDIDYGLDLIENLKPRKFTWDSRDGTKQGQKEIGFIAQELQEVDDEYLNFVLDSNPDKLEAGWMQLVPVLVKAVQELSAEVKELKQQLKS